MIQMWNAKSNPQSFCIVPHIPVTGSQQNSLERSSPALELTPGQSVSHTHRVFHFVGPKPELDKIAAATLNVTLEEIKNAL